MKRKLERFKIIEERSNVIERSKDIYESIKGCIVGLEAKVTSWL